MNEQMKAFLFKIIAYLFKRLGVPRYIIQGKQPHNVKWVHDLPYYQINKMLWSKEKSFYELESSPTLLFSIVDLYTGYSTQILSDKKRVYAFTAHQGRGKDGQYHPTKGYNWIELIPFEW